MYCYCVSGWVRGWVSEGWKDWLADWLLFWFAASFGYRYLNRDFVNILVSSHPFQVAWLELVDVWLVIPQEWRPSARVGGSQCRQTAELWNLPFGNCSHLSPGAPQVPSEDLHSKQTHDRLLHLHLSLNCGGRWGTTDDFTASFLQFSLFSTALRSFANSRPVHSFIVFPPFYWFALSPPPPLHCALQDGFG